MVVGIVILGSIVLMVVVLVLVVLMIGGNVDADFADDVLAQDHKGCAHARFEGDPVAVDIDDVPDNPTGGEDLVPDFELIDQLTLVLCLLALRAENQKVEVGAHSGETVAQAVVTLIPPHSRSPYFGDLGPQLGESALAD